MKKYTCLIEEATFFRPQTGIPRFVKEVSKRLFCGTGSPFIYKGYRGCTLPPWANNKLLAKFYTNYIFNKEYGMLDLYWEPNHIFHNWGQARKIIMTVHDLTLLKYPQWIPRPSEWVDYLCQHFVTGLKKADRIITDSETVMQELIEYAPMVENKTYLVHLGIGHVNFSPAEEPNKEKSDEKYILYVGSIQPRKNLLNLIKAYASLPVSFKKEYKLLLAGADGWLNAEIMELVSKTPEYVFLKGKVSERELVQLYRNASLSVYIPFYEGFGFPPLEAMACGTPVLISEIPVLREVCGDAAAYADPNDIEAIASQMLGITQRDAAQKKEWQEKGILRAARYTWDKTADLYRKHFLEVLS